MAIKSSKTSPWSLDDQCVLYCDFSRANAKWQYVCSAIWKRLEPSASLPHTRPFGSQCGQDRWRRAGVEACCEGDHGRVLAADYEKDVCMWQDSMSPTSKEIQL